MHDRDGDQHPLRLSHTDLRWVAVAKLPVLRQAAADQRTDDGGAGGPTLYLLHPRICCISLFDAFIRSCPRNRMLALALPSFHPSSFRMASAIVLLPDPLSPTNPSTSRV